MSNTPLISDSSRAETAVEYARWERERERQRIEIQEGPKAAAAFAARQPVDPAPDAPPDLGDPAEILDPPEAVFQVGPHRLVFRELTYKQAKGLLRVSWKAVRAVLRHPEFLLLPGQDVFQNILLNVPVIADVASAEVIQFVAEIHGLEPKALEDHVRFHQVVEMLTVLLQQNAFEIRAVVKQLKNLRTQAESLGLVILQGGGMATPGENSSNV